MSLAAWITTILLVLFVYAMVAPLWVGRGEQAECDDLDDNQEL